MLMGKIWAENKISQLIFYLCQQILYYTLSQKEKEKCENGEISQTEFAQWLKGT